jgi:aspartyl protease family protein
VRIDRLEQPAGVIEPTVTKTIRDPEQHFPRRLGRLMLLAAWVVALGLLTLLFRNVLEKQENPNRDAQAVTDAEGRPQVVLERNRAGHYVASGRINGQPVVFLLDTGATDVAVPGGVARRLGLSKGAPKISRTANGDVTAWATRLRSVDLGGLVMHDVSATILPNMVGDQVLLGMSYLKKLELVQTGSTLRLRYPG